jgi:hypothetical protein
MYERGRPTNMARMRRKICMRMSMRMRKRMMTMMIMIMIMQGGWQARLLR